MKPPLSLRISDLMDNPKLLGPYFAGPSWDTWRAVLKASFAEKMSAAELAIFKEVAGGRNPPKHRIAEGIYAVGRGGGKEFHGRPCRDLPGREFQSERQAPAWRGCNNFMRRRQ